MASVIALPLSFLVPVLLATGRVGPLAAGLVALAAAAVVQPAAPGDVALRLGHDFAVGT